MFVCLFSMQVTEILRTHGPCRGLYSAGQKIIFLSVFSYIKGPKHEQCVAGIFTQIRLVWIGELETSKNLWLGPFIFFIGEIFFNDVGDSAKKYKMTIFKPKP
jgi:hypothetical protein